MAGVIAFICFSFCASAVYILNDLADLSADRRHPTKQKRPFAAGDLSISLGIAVSSGLLVAGFSLAWLALPLSFFGTLALYFLITCEYSFHAKRIAMFDVLMLAGLYTIRVIAGGAATKIAISEWLLAFSMFLFVSLAFAKRCAELERLARTKETRVSGRGYRIADLALIESMGHSSGYISVLVLALYLNGDQMKALYRTSWPLWLICPLLMYWISRVWLKVKRGELSEDPVVFAVKDRVSKLLGVIVFLLLAIASLSG
jgi:4-hydroxybenzoate polyprenyltransferase